MDARSVATAAKVCMDALVVLTEAVAKFPPRRIWRLGNVLKHLWHLRM